MQVKLEGTDKALKSLQKLQGKELERAMRKWMNQAIQVILEEAKRRASFVKGYSTGALKESLRKKLKKKRDGTLQAKVEAWYPEPGDKKKYYAFAVEYGTKTQGPQPFLHPAGEAKKEEVVKIMTDGMEDLVREAERRGK
jgi:HK97 gp10 family phage protein